MDRSATSFDKSTTTTIHVNSKDSTKMKRKHKPFMVHCQSATVEQNRSATLTRFHAMFAPELESVDGSLANGLITPRKVKLLHLIMFPQQLVLCIGKQQEIALVPGAVCCDR